MEIQGRRKVFAAEFGHSPTVDRDRRGRCQVEDQVMKILVIAGATFGTSPRATVFHAVVQRWQRQMLRLRDPYRPELHYMRGPGPKWREKHGL